MSKFFEYAKTKNRRITNNLIDDIYIDKIYIRHIAKDKFITLDVFFTDEGNFQMHWDDVKGYAQRQNIYVSVCRFDNLLRLYIKEDYIEFDSVQIAEIKDRKKTFMLTTVARTPAGNVHNIELILEIFRFSDNE